VEPWAALVIGAIGGVVVVGAVLGFDRIKIDDPVGAISVHGVCGIWGTLSIGLFATFDDAFLGRADAGLFYGGGTDQLLMQAVMVLIVMAWVIPASGLVFLALKATIGLRVTEEEELMGLDVLEHGAPGYGADMNISPIPTAPRGDTLDLGAPVSRPSPATA
ncbi:MAG: ammonium transporter, partial [Acidimicrobiales bacterium]